MIRRCRAKVDAADFGYESDPRVENSSKGGRGLAGRKVHEFANDGKGPDHWPFDAPFYLLMNLAIGGEWGGQKGIDEKIFRWNTTSTTCACGSAERGLARFIRTGSDTRMALK